jgi:hypothetical protein
MAQIISLDDYRKRRARGASSLQRLDLAVGRLEPLVKGREGHMSPAVERELTRIATAVAAGSPEVAAARAERLADLLEHPAALG